MSTIDDLLAQVEANRNQIIELEQELVRIPSVNTGFMPTGNETPVCEFAQGWLAKDGIASEILESAPGRGNLIARMEGRSGKAGLLFMSHTDVVPGGGGGEVALRSVQRHHRGGPYLRTGRVRLQGTADRPAVCHAPAEEQRHRASRLAGAGLRRG